ncbi:MAG: hypothetical protein SOY56_06260 [Anaerovoracaceae bacterium]|nr:hypothetical protein [Anaerovoracaceae bacterium]
MSCFKLMENRFLTRLSVSIFIALCLMCATGFSSYVFADSDEAHVDSNNNAEFNHEEEGVVEPKAFKNDLKESNNDNSSYFKSAMKSSMEKQPLYGLVNDDDVGFRTRPFVSSETLIRQLGKGAEVLIKGDNEGWYLVEVNGVTGYIYGQYVDIEKEYKYNQAFEDEMNRQGFSESYKVQLRKAYSIHPEWIFVADHTGIRWDDAVDKENGYAGNTKYNVVWYSYPDEYKSKRIDGETDYGSQWAPASKYAIEHFMDPRNFISSNSIFQFISSRYDSSIQTRDGIKLIIKGSFMDGANPGDGYRSYADLIMEAARQSGVSAYMIASMIINEQGRYGSPASFGTVKGYEGYYNFFNIGATDGVGANTRGAIYAKGRGWTSPAKSIIEGASWFADGYINNRQYTPYLKKFNVMNGIENVPYHQYMTNVSGAYQEGNAQAEAYLKIGRIPIVFNIPIFLNMPGENYVDYSFSLDVNDCTLEKGKKIGFLAKTSRKIGSPTIINSDNRVASVRLVNPLDERGYYFELDAHNKGESIITVNYNGVEKHFKVTVTENNIHNINYHLDIRDCTIKNGKRLGFLALIRDKKSTPKVTSSRRDVAEARLVDAGDSRGYYFEVYGKSPGTSRITVEYVGVKRSFNVTVESGVNYSLDVRNCTIKNGRRLGFLALIRDKKSTPKVTSSRRDVAEARLVDAGDSRGYYFEVYGKSPGTSRITVEYLGVKRSFNVTVK